MLLFCLDDNFLVQVIAQLEICWLSTEDLIDEVEVEGGISKDYRGHKILNLEGDRKGKK